jgi:aminoglycoside phosphotransferase (APT) family kinase protein
MSAGVAPGRTTDDPQDRIDLPTAPEGIDAQWVQAALRVRYPGVGVTSVTVGEVIWGTASKVRVLVNYDAAGHAAGLPASFVVKAGFGRHELAAAMISFFESEVLFYRELAPGLDGVLDPAPPRCHFAGMRREQGRAVVLLEDLYARNAVFGEPGEPMGLPVVEQGLAQLARVHAATWGRADLGSLGTYPGDMRGVLLQVIDGEYWDRCLAKPRAAGLPAALRGPGAMRAAVEALWALDAAEATSLIHGDAHCGNTFTDRDGRPGFVDWQMAGRGHWAHDVAYLVIMALEPADRRAHERRLLTGYLAALAEAGVEVPDDDTAWAAYRRHAVHGLFWAANPDGMYPEEVNTRIVARFAEATADLDALALLRP